MIDMGPSLTWKYFWLFVYEVKPTQYTPVVQVTR